MGICLVVGEDQAVENGIQRRGLILIRKRRIMVNDRQPYDSYIPIPCPLCGQDYIGEDCTMCPDCKHEVELETELFILENSIREMQKKV